MAATSAVTAAAGADHVEVGFRTGDAAHIVTLVSTPKA